MRLLFPSAMPARSAFIWLCCILLSGNVTAAKVIDPDTAVRRTLLNSPELQAFPYQQRALEAEALQAGLRPNPVLQANVENVLGTGNSRGLQGAELTLSLSQKIELGNKRARRVDVVDERSAQRQRDYEIQRLDVVAATLRDYYRALRQQAMQQWNQKRIERLQTAYDMIDERAQAGAVGKADVSRMLLRLRRAESRQAQLQDETRLAYLKLASNWAESPDFDGLAGSLSALPDVPSKARLDEAIAQTPMYLSQLAQSRLREAELSLQQANAQADITFGAGVRRFEGLNDNALVFSLSMPLQLHDRNQGNVQRAQARHQESLVRQTLNEAQIRQSLYEIRLSLKNNVRQAGLLADELMPVAGDLLRETQSGYQHGQYGVLQWVDAQDALFDVQRELIDARLAAFLQMLELERLTGQAMSEMTPDSATGGKK